MAIDHNLITPIMCKDDPLHTCDIVGGGDRWGFRVNQDTLITNNTLSYVLAYRKELFTNRGIVVPADHDLSWDKRVPSLWTPDDRINTSTDIFGWWKFDELNQTLSAGDSIVTVNDSGPSRDTDLTAAGGILFNQDHFGGMGTADMTADDDVFSAPDSSNLDVNAQKLEMYCVFKTGSDYTSTFSGVNDARFFMSKVDSSTYAPSLRWFINRNDNRGALTYKQTLQRSTSGVNKKEGNNFSPGDGNSYMYGLHYDVSDNTVDFYIDGDSNGTPTGDLILDPDTDGVLYIGNTAAATQGIQSYLGELLIINGAGSISPSAAERQLIEGYLAHKWGLEGSLPSGHPYETDPPRRASVYT
tara:strand:- start:5827 stop:6897 length:1071 start_codon:yes stop_codon:yes gene_type:complete